MDLAWHQGCASSRTAIHSVGGPAALFADRPGDPPWNARQLRSGSASRHGGKRHAKAGGIRNEPFGTGLASGRRGPQGRTWAVA